MMKAKDELVKVLNDKELKDCHVLILANKQDLPNALSPHDIIEKLELKNLNSHEWTVIPAVATTGDGLNDVLQWISNHYG